MSICLLQQIIFLINLTYFLALLVILLRLILFVVCYSLKFKFINYNDYLLLSNYPFYNVLGFYSELGLEQSVILIRLLFSEILNSFRIEFGSNSLGNVFKNISSVQFFKTFSLVLIL